MATPSEINEIPEDIRITRACATLRKAFLAYLEASWIKFSKEIVTPTKAGVPVCMIDDPTRAGRRNGWFGIFPNHQISDPVIKDAVLTTMACHEIGYMKKLIEQMFEGLNVDFEEVRAHVKPDGFRVVIKYAAGRTDHNNYDFWFMRMTSRTSGKQFAFDLSGLQFGIEYVISPWESYVAINIKEILAIKPFGTLAAFTAEVAQTKGVTGMHYDVSTKAMQAWHEVVDPAMKKKGLSWAAIFKKPATDYVRHKEKVLKVGKKAIETWVANQRLTKRRLKAERFDDRHDGLILDEMDALSDKYFEEEVKGEVASPKTPK